MQETSRSARRMKRARLLVSTLSNEGRNVDAQTVEDLLRTAHALRETASRLYHDNMALRAAEKG